MNYCMWMIKSYSTITAEEIMGYLVLTYLITLFSSCEIPGIDLATIYLLFPKKIYEFLDMCRFKWKNLSIILNTDWLVGPLLLC